MALHLPVGPYLLVDGADACLLERALHREIGRAYRRDGAVPARLARLSDEVSRTAREFRAFVLVEPNSGTTGDSSDAVTPVSGGSERLSAQEAARLVGVSTELIRRLASRGVLEGTRTGHRGGWELDPGSVAAWAASRSKTKAA